MTSREDVARPPTGASMFINEAKQAVAAGRWDREFLEAMQARLDGEGAAVTAEKSIYKRPGQLSPRVPAGPRKGGRSDARQQPRLSMLTKRYLHSVGRMPSKHMEGRLNRKIREDTAKAQIRRAEETEDTTYSPRTMRALYKAAGYEIDGRKSPYAGEQERPFAQFGMRAFDQSVMKRKTRDVSHLYSERSSDNVYRLMKATQVLHPNDPRLKETKGNSTNASRNPSGMGDTAPAAPEASVGSLVEAEPVPPIPASGRSSRRPSARSATSIPPTLIPEEFHIVEPAPLERAGEHDEQQMHYDHKKGIWTKTVFPSLLPSSRHETVLLREWASSALAALSRANDIEDDDSMEGQHDAKQERLQRKAQVLHITFNELIRQVTVHCWERGSLLSDVWNTALETFEDIAPSTRMRQELLVAHDEIEDLKERLAMAERTNRTLSRQVEQSKEMAMGHGGGGTLSDLSTLPERVALRYEQMEAELYAQERRANSFLIQVANKEQMIKKLKDLLQVTVRVNQSWQAEIEEATAARKALDALDEESEEEADSLHSRSTSRGPSRGPSRNQQEDTPAQATRTVTLNEFGEDISLKPKETDEQVLQKFGSSTQAMLALWEHVQEVRARNHDLSERLATLVGERSDAGVQTDDWRPLLMPKATQTITIAPTDTKRRRRKVDRAVSKATLLTKKSSVAKMSARHVSSEADIGRNKSPEDAEDDEQ